MRGCLYKNKSWQDRRKTERDTDYGMLLFLYKGRLWRAPAVYWFSELLYSHCYPRVPSTVHWTHAAPQAAIPVWEAPALTTGPSQITHQRRIHTLSSLNSFRWGRSGPTLGNEAHSHVFKIFFVCGVEDGEYVFFTNERIRLYSTASWGGGGRVKGSDQLGKPIFQTHCPYTCCSCWED